ncbi:HNH endonuclease [Mycobacterium phage Antsirabe]|uniref:HNH endonuclease n=1 Tax=Mycobacterium phage Antsirabe TaxID=2575610 RepID=A0A5J6TH46_9CAUD|nr:HNH endonuclease [Mycobacterium phage Antsirabe]QFG09995.1 HNH endonuclease [Mycobacterium phage Antsirabe]
MLDPGEVSVAHHVAAQRAFVNGAAGVQDQRADCGSLGTAADLDLIGVVGELAFAKWQGIFPDLTAFPRAGTPDYTIGGWTWDVKATKHAGGELICPLSAKADAQLYALAIVQATGQFSFVVRFPGWATRDELIRPERISNDPKFRTRCYAIPQAELRGWKEAVA